MLTLHQWMERGSCQATVVSHWRSPWRWSINRRGQRSVGWKEDRTGWKYSPYIATYVAVNEGSTHLLTHLPLDKNGHHFADNIFKHIFLNENIRIAIQISLKFVPEGPVDNKSALVQVMAWRRTGDKPLSEPMLTQFSNAYLRH